VGSILRVQKRKDFIQLNPPRLLALGFMGLIFLGTILLMLPVSTYPGRRLSFVDAMFEATSAVCVTGLVVVDTATTFTLFGQVVIMTLIQIGGLGFMTFGIFVAVLIGKDIGLKERLVIQESLNEISLSGLVKLVKSIVFVTILIEGVGGIPQELVFRALSISMIAIFAMVVALFLLNTTEDHLSIEVLAFEVVSAFGTVGLSLGATPQLSTFGKIVIMIMMFIGRLGPLTIAFALTRRHPNRSIRYPEEKILIG
jgi:Trk-type K+ transport system membrane component